jgi:hypothetical protein
MKDAEEEKEEACDVIWYYRLGIRNRKENLLTSFCKKMKRQK